MKKLILLLFVAIALVSCEKDELSGLNHISYIGTPGIYYIEVAYEDTIYTQLINSKDVWISNIVTDYGFIPSIKVVQKISSGQVVVSIKKNSETIYTKDY